MPSSNNRRHRRRNYTSVANEDGDDVDDDDFHDEPEASSATSATKNDSSSSEHDDDEEEEEDDEEKEEQLPMSITILDSAQKKFPIPCDKRWTVGKFKRRSAKIHKVAPAQQRLIFRGKMLTKDDQTLEDNKLDTSDLIVHLFPKPRVVVTAHKKDEPEVKRDDDDDDDGDSGIVDNENGAHVPSIIIDQEEQERRGQILVLGSVEIVESQNNIKMLSLLLVMICSMRLMALFSIAIGTAEEQADPWGNGDGSNNHTSSSSIYDTDDSITDPYAARPWQNQDFFDLLVSGIGFYVGCLGMRATQENTLKLATYYAIGTIIAGIGWNLWNVYEYYEFFNVTMERQKIQNLNNHSAGWEPDYDNYDDPTDTTLTRDDFITYAFFSIIMPLFVWFLCCVRAFEFRRLIREAEEEAAERIRNEYTETDIANGDEDDGAAEATPINTGPEIV